MENTQKNWTMAEYQEHQIRLTIIEREQMEIKEHQKDYNSDLKNIYKKIENINSEENKKIKSQNTWLLTTIVGLVITLLTMILGGLI